MLFPGLTTLLLGQNYHLIHHLYPAVPFFRYGACFREIRADLAVRGAPIMDLRQDLRAALRFNPPA